MSNTIFRAASILLCLSDGINTVSDIAEHTKISKTTVHRLLTALEESQLAMKDPLNHRYYLGHLIAHIGSQLKTTHEHMIICATDELKHLSDYTEETVSLGIQVGIQYLSLCEIPSKHDPIIIIESRRMVPLLAGATSKVLLSQLNDEEMELILQFIKLEPITDHTITDKEKFIADVKQARQQGCAITYGERLPGFIGMAAAVCNYTCPAVLNILGPEIRLKPRLNEFLEELKASAGRVSRNITKIFQLKEAK
ncbi:MAG TPA: IclR family transcriptional regulator [Dehalococcoidales bacterium]|nr:IclR family transcriptional regulator [Dehalococcoidales bacterium]